MILVVQNAFSMFLDFKKYSAIFVRSIFILFQSFIPEIEEWRRRKSVTKFVLSASADEKRRYFFAWRRPFNVDVIVVVVVDVVIVVVGKCNSNEPVNPAGHQGLIHKGTVELFCSSWL